MTKAAVAEVDPPAKSKRKQEVAKVAPTHAVAADAPRSMLDSILAASLDPRVDVAKMTVLSKLLDEERQRQAEREAFSALISLQAARPRIAKDRKSDRHAYATLEKVSAELDPLMSQYGFGLTTTMVDSPLEGHYRVKGVLMHGHSGWSREYFLDFPMGAHKSPGGQKDLMSPSQGVGVILSYGRRYLKLLIFDVTIAGEDIDGALPADLTPISAKQLEKLQIAIDFKSVNVPKLLEKFGAPSLEDFPRAKFDKAMSLIAQKDAPAPKETQGE